MSILDALRVQKANQQSVSQLAALPQNEIIRLAQMGHIPADMVPVVISEKARMAKEMANLQAAAQTQGRQMPTVIEQAMQANAQSEGGMPPAPQQAPMQPPAQPQAAPPGVAGLPTGQMFQGQNFEAGGIVAFNDGGMPEMPSNELVRAFSNVAKDKTTGQDIEVLMAGLGMDEGTLGVNVAKISGNQREDLAKMLVAQYGTQFGDLNVSGQAMKAIDGPSGTYRLGAQASYPVGAGRLSAGIGALRSPQETRITGTNLGYDMPIGSGRLSAGVNLPRGAAPQGQIQYRMPFEQGGIVAFNGEDDSFVEGPTGLKMLRSEAGMPQTRRAPSLSQAIETARSQLAPAFAETPEEAAYREALKRGMMSPEDRSQQKYMRLLEAGLGILGGESPYGLTNIGRGAQTALRGYGEDLRLQQAQKLSELKTAAEASKAKRLEGAKAVELGSQIYGKELENAYRTAALDRNTDFQRRVTNFIPEAMAEIGINDPKNPRVIALATRKADESAGFALGRTESREGISDAERRSNAEIARDNRRLRAEIAWGNLPLLDRDKREYNRLKKDNPAAAEALKDAWIENAASLQPSRPAPAPSSATKPDISKVPNAPRGATVGKLVEGKGWEVLGSDGKLVGYLQP
jgi:hypothetical protein